MTRLTGPELTLKITELRNQGHTVKEIAALTGAHISTVHRRLKQLEERDHPSPDPDRLPPPTPPRRPNALPQTSKDIWADLQEQIFYWRSHAQHYRQRAQQLENRNP